MIPLHHKFVIGRMDYHYYDGVHLWGSRDGRVFRSADLGSTWNEYLRVNTPLMTHFRTYNRLTRNGIHNVIPLNSETIVVVVKGRFLVFHQKNLVTEVSTQTGRHPMRQGVLEHGGQIMYGDYWGNPNREPVRICRFDPFKGDLEVLLTFRNKRHIHFMLEDIHNPGRLFVGTGDEDNESGIYRYDLNTGALETIGCGSQAWRAVSLLQQGDYLYWGSDCPYEQNYIYRLNRCAGVVERIRPISGPAYHSAMNSEGRMFLATTIERRGEHKAIVYGSGDGEEWEEVREWRKDFLPAKLFGYGKVEFIHGQEALRDVFINLRGLR